MVKPGTKEDAEAIDKGLKEFCGETVPTNHDNTPLSRRVVDTEGNMIAAVICGVDEEDTGEIDGIWAEGGYRRQDIALGSW